MMQTLGYILFVVHCLLLVWAIGGSIELISTEVPWKPLANPDFPNWLLVFHWGSVLVASTLFIYGFLTRWRRTPHAMLSAYGLMALVCVVETFGFMTTESKYLAMGAEYLAYTVILLLLFKSNHFLAFFKQ